MNFYDIFVTLTNNPEASSSMQSICEYCGCQNQLEALKQSLWKKPSRVQSPGAFPFNEETGKIYDVLWKAAQAENYGTAEKVGRWFMKLICPPADDEGMGRFHEKYHEATEAPKAPSAAKTSSTPKKPEFLSASNQGSFEEPINQEPENDWKVDDEDEDDKNTIVATRKPDETGLTKRPSNKKND